MKKYVVIAEFVDVETGDRISPGEAGAEPVTFIPHDDGQEQRLLDAGCLKPAGERAPKAEQTEEKAVEAKATPAPAKGPAKAKAD